MTTNMPCNTQNGVEFFVDGKPVDIETVDIKIYRKRAPLYEMTPSTWNGYY